MKRSLLTVLSAAILLVSGAPAQQPKPDLKQLASDAKALDQLQKIFTSTPQFGDQFWRASKDLADERGPDLLHAIMVRGRAWQGEEGLMFVPLVALLPRDPTLKLLKEYERSKLESDRIWALEFQAEFEVGDTQEMVRKYSKPK